MKNFNDLFNGNKNGGNNSKKDKKIRKYRIIAMAMAMTIFLMMIYLYQAANIAIEENDIPYTEFTKMVEEKKVKDVQINLNESKFVFTDTEDNVYVSDNPKTKEFKEYLLLNNVEVEEIEENKLLASLVSSIPTIIYLVFLMSLFKNMMPGSKDDNGLVKTKPDITFNDIAGEKELKRDLQFIVQYLKDPKKYTEIGARMPKGIILYGPPGTGKTLTAKAIAGTAGVPFFSVSGADFIELYVGLGAKRVRELYKKAKESAPCIVFIDEIDAVGGKRNSAASHTESNQTINALLNELDGFNGTEGILTIAATNLVDSLDPALIRPGRFDKQMAVPMPEREDREKIIEIHCRGKKIANDVDFGEVATMTVGFSGASLEALMNEAAFIAVSNGHQVIQMEDIDHAFYKMVMKGDRKDDQSHRDKEELEIVAWHEASHALATKLYTEDNVPKVTIVSSTSGAGGVTFRNPKEMHLLSKKYIEGIIKVMYAGRAGEKCFLGSDDMITTGASSDIKQASEIIKEYISVYGMNEKYGLINLSTFSTIENNQIIEEAASISKKLYSDVEKDIMNYKDVLAEIVEELLKNESIDEKALDNILTKHGIIIKSKNLN